MMMRRRPYSVTRKCTYDVVVLAADRCCAALTLANADDGDGGAVEANGHTRVESEAEEVEDLSDGSSSASLFKMDQIIVGRKGFDNITVWV